MYILQYTDTWKMCMKLSIRAKFQYPQWGEAAESTPISLLQALNFNKVYFYLGGQHIGNYFNYFNYYNYFILYLFNIYLFINIKYLFNIYIIFI